MRPGKEELSSMHVEKRRTEELAMREKQGRVGVAGGTRRPAPSGRAAGVACGRCAIGDGEGRVGEGEENTRGEDAGRK